MGAGLGVFGFVLPVAIFLIAVGLTRWIFGIHKMIDLLTIIAQELKARNVLDDVHAGLKEKDLYSLVDNLRPKDYSVKPGAAILSKPLK